MSLFAHYDAHGLPATCEEVERVRSITGQILRDANAEMTRLRAAVARAEQATAEVRLTSVWWAYDDSDYDAWESNALFGDEQHALAYALDAWAKCERNRCADHDDEPASDCEDCQGMAAYVARLEWRKVANRWELWDKGVEPQWKPSWSGITVAPNKVHWPEAADVPAASEVCGSCNGSRWVDDQNWQPEDYERARGRMIGSGRIPCGICNHGGWGIPDGASEATP